MNLAFMLEDVYDVTCGNFSGQFSPAIPALVRTVVTFIEIFVPVILVILGMIDIFKAVIAQKDDDMKKAQGILIKRFIYAVLVFFIVFLVKFVFSTIDKNSDSINTVNCVNCFISDSSACKKVPAKK